MAGPEQRKQVWQEFGALLVVAAVAVGLIALLALWLDSVYGTGYRNQFEHCMIGAAAPVIAQLHPTLSFSYVFIIVAYQNKQQSISSADFAGYAGGLFVATLVIMLYQFFVRPSLFERPMKYYKLTQKRRDVTLADKFN